MKHLFFVQSHITFYLSLSIQAWLKIPKDEVIYILLRNYKNRFHPQLKSFQIENFPHLHRLKVNTGFLKLYRRLQAYKEVDAWLKNTIQDSFCLYTNGFQPYSRIFHFHPLCRKTVFFEEGSLSYSNLLSNKKYIIKRFFARFFKIINFFSSGRLTVYELQGDTKSTVPRLAYAIDKKAFAKVSGVQPVLIPFYKEGKMKNLSKLPPSRSCIIIIGNDVLSSEKINKKYYSIVLSEVWEKMLLLSLDFHTCYIKYHPAQTKEGFDIVESLIKKLNMKIHRINADIPLEQIFALKRTYTVIGTRSSLLLYAKVFNKKNTVISFQNHIEKAIKDEDKKYLSVQSEDWLKPFLNKEF